MAEDSILDDESTSLEGDDEPISLVDSEGEGTEFAPGGVKTFGITGEGEQRKEFSGTLNTNGTGATRCRTFHSKIAVPSLEFMENQINGWLDAEDIEVKHVGHIIGTMEGKRPEPNLIVLVWY